MTNVLQILAYLSAVPDFSLWQLSSGELLSDFVVGTSSKDGLPKERSKRETKRAAAADAKDQWREFPHLAGTHLSFRTLKRGSWEVVAADGVIWTTSCDGYFLNPKSTISMRGHEYRWQMEHSYPRYQLKMGRPLDRELVDVASGASVLRMEGVHFESRAGTRVTMADHTAIELPVTGRSIFHATMAAVDESGNRVMQYRVNWSADRRAAFRNPYKVTEVVVTSAGRTIPNIELLAAVTAGCLRGYFKRRGGSGG